MFFLSLGIIYKGKQIERRKEFSQLSQVRKENDDLTQFEKQITQLFSDKEKGFLKPITTQETVEQLKEKLGKLVNSDASFQSKFMDQLIEIEVQLQVQTQLNALLIEPMIAFEAMQEQQELNENVTTEKIVNIENLLKQYKKENQWKKNLKYYQKQLAQQWENIVVIQTELTTLLEQRTFLSLEQKEALFIQIAQLESQKWQEILNNQLNQLTITQPVVEQREVEQEPTVQEVPNISVPINPTPTLPVVPEPSPNPIPEPDQEVEPDPDESPESSTPSLPEIGSSEEA